MKILHVIPDLSPASGGPVAAVLGLAGEQASCGHEVSIAATAQGRKGALAPEGVSVRLFPLSFPYWKCSQGLGRFLGREISGFDITHIHGLWEYPSWAAARACRKNGLPYIIRPHGSIDSWPMSQKTWKKNAHLFLFGRRMLACAAALHGTSAREVEGLLMRRWNTSCFVMPVGLPPSTSEDLPERAVFFERYPVLKGCQIVIFVGRLHYVKQPEVIIRAFHAACGSGKEATLVMAGPVDPGYLKSLQNLAGELDIADRVHFTGMLQGRAVQEALRAADLFVLPSLHENFGIAVAEAMAAGCPVVISDRVDLAPEVVRAGAGIVTDLSVKSTAEAISRLLSDDALRHRMGEKGRRLVLDQFTCQKVTRDLEEVYRDILSGRRESAAWRG